MVGNNSRKKDPISILNLIGYSFPSLLLFIWIIRHSSLFTHFPLTKYFTYFVVEILIKPCLRIVDQTLFLGCWEFQHQIELAYHYDKRFWCSSHFYKPMIKICHVLPHFYMCRTICWIPFFCWWWTDRVIGRWDNMLLLTALSWIA